MDRFLAGQAGVGHTGARHESGRVEQERDERFRPVGQLSGDEGATRETVQRWTDDTVRPTDAGDVTNRVIIVLT